MATTISAFIRRLFGLAPRYHTSAYSSVYRAVVSCLRREGVQVGGGAGYPRVEIHSLLESGRLDKEGMLRELSLTVESISNRSLEEASTLNEGNMELLTGSELSLGTDWSFVGIVPDQLQDLTETSDPQKILYRIIQSYRLYVEKVKTVSEENTDNNNS